MPKAIIIPEEMLCQLIEEYLAGSSLSELHEKYNYPRAKIRKLFLEHNVQLRSVAEYTRLLQIKTRKTVKEKYGCDNVFQAEEVKQKIQITIQDKYGVDYISQAPAVRQKVEQTMLDNFGVKNALQSEEIKQKIRNDHNGQWTTTAESVKKTAETKFIKYGDARYNNKEQTKSTCLDKYGETTPLKNEVVKQKIRDTMLERYGVEYYSQLDECADKIKATCLQRYGVENYSQTLQFHEHARKLYNFNEQHFDSLPELAVYIYCIDHQISICRNTTIKFKYEFDGDTHYYFPDFIINDKLVEVKGDHFFKPDGTMCNPFDHTQDSLYESKHQCMLTNNVTVWRRKDYWPMIEYFNINYYIKDNEVLKYERN